jgi:hypothetical protein
MQNEHTLVAGYQIGGTCCFLLQGISYGKVYVSFCIPVSCLRINASLQKSCIGYGGGLETAFFF